jgi:serine/threonine protein kinase
LARSSLYRDLNEGTLQQFALTHRFELPDILSVASQIAQGLRAAHEAGLVHRDIKPSNIMLQNGLDEVVISDFGVARVMDDDSRTHSMMLAGTPQFMSPEQAQGLPVDARSDLFSVGSLLYWMCTGTTPFASETSFGVLTKIAQQPHVPVTQLSHSTPSWFNRLVDRLLEKQPQNRIASAKQLDELLQACLAHLEAPDKNKLPSELITTLDALPLPANSVRWPWQISRGVKISALVVVILLAIGGLMFSNWAGRSGE